ncbi:MAG: cobalamin-dependent protein, partial [Candidatus Muiribacteriaceae bacterium]
MKIAMVLQAYESIAFERFSTMIKKNGHSCRFFFDPALFSDYSLDIPLLNRIFSLNIRNLTGKIIDYSPDLVFFTVYTENLNWVSNTAALIKKENPNIQIVCGGPHCTCSPSGLTDNPNIDKVIRGSGDDYLDSLLRESEYDNKSWSACITDTYKDIKEDKEE